MYTHQKAKIVGKCFPHTRHMLIYQLAPSRHDELSNFWPLPAFLGETRVYSSHIHHDIVPGTYTLAEIAEIAEMAMNTLQAHKVS